MGSPHRLGGHHDGPFWLGLVLVRPPSLRLLQYVSSFLRHLSPILTFLVLLFLPSTLTLLTLLIHRIRSARAARRERAPENVVHNLPWRTWEGQQTVMELEKLLDVGEAEEVEHVANEGLPEPSTSRTDQVQTPAVTIERHWYDTQGECAICLEDFAKGDKVRVLPCRHIFHMGGFFSSFWLCCDLSFRGGR